MLAVEEKCGNYKELGAAADGWSLWPLLKYLVAEHYKCIDLHIRVVVCFFLVLFSFFGGGGGRGQGCVLVDGMQGREFSAGRSHLVYEAKSWCSLNVRL